MTQTRTLLYIVNDAGYFFSHRFKLAQEAQKNGWSIHVAVPHVSPLDQDRFTAADIVAHALNNPSKSINYLLSIGALYRVVKDVKPGLIHVITLKCTLKWALVAPFFTRFETIHTIAGFGSLTRQKWLYRALKYFVFLVLAALAKFTSARLVVQNAGDAATLSALRMMPPRALYLVEGSGVDTTLFTPGKARATPATILKIGTAARRLNSKGLPALARIAKLARDRNLPFRFVVASVAADGHSDAIPDGKWQGWLNEDLFEDAGHVTDMPAFYQSLDGFFYLSSYGEGLAKTLLEAGASALPIITTDQPGCREAVIDGVSGHLLSGMDDEAILGKLMAWHAEPTRRKAMGKASRAHIEAKLSDEVVIDRMMALYRGIAS